MPATQIAAQLYTLRDYTKTPADIVTTLKRVKQIGYDAVQLSALGPIDSKELARLLSGEGLTVAATHTPLPRLTENVRAVIDDHAIWGCSYTAIGGYFPTAPSWEDWKRFAGEFVELSKAFAGSPVTLGYHNHSHELTRFADSPTVLDMLIDTLPPSVWFELDTYWITHGGGDPAEWVGKVAERIPCVHLKDMSITPQREQRMAEVGAGNLNWQAILPACRAAGVKWYIVEQDETYGADPFECLGRSLRNLKALGLD